MWKNPRELKVMQRHLDNTWATTEETEEEDPDLLEEDIEEIDLEVEEEETLEKEEVLEKNIEAATLEIDMDQEIEKRTTEERETIEIIETDQDLEADIEIDLILDLEEDNAELKTQYISKVTY